MTSILVVEDERTLLETIGYNLRREGYRVLTAADGEMALDTVQRERPDLVVLDLMLPRVDGLEVCRLLRHESSVPILMLTARADEVDRVVGLEMGADDYLTKPFSMRELLARVKAILRRIQMVRSEERDSPATAVIRSGDLEIHGARRRVTLAGREVAMKPREFDLLAFLARYPGQVFNRETLLQRVWGYEYGGDTRTVDVHIRSLRKKIEPNPAQPVRLQTVWGVGYRFAG